MEESPLVSMKPGRKPTILVLLKELTKQSDLKHEKRFVDELRRHANIVIIAQCYLRSDARLRRLECPFETYAFGPGAYEAEVERLAARLNRAHAPDWVLAYGPTNPQLAVALDRLGLAVLSFVPEAPAADAATHLIAIFKHAADIVVADAAMTHDLDDAALALEARTFRLVSDLMAEAVPAHPTSESKRGLRDRVLALLGARKPRSAQDAEARERSAARAVLHHGQDVARENIRRIKQAGVDAATIEGSQLFCPQLAVPHDVSVDDATALAMYLRASAHARPRATMASGRLVRRPAKGFNPLIYATDASGFDEESGEDPLAHFIRSGQPQGRWTHRVLDCGQLSASAGSLPKTAIHLHLHYPDLLEDFLQRLRNQQREGVDLFITATSPKAAADIDGMLRGARETTQVIVCPNRGRDVWPFVDLLQSGMFDDYEVVGHFHSKRSAHYALGDLWRDFLWAHLIGGRGACMDRIRASFAGDPSLGLVFAEEPHLEGWDANLKLSTMLAQTMGIKTPLPAHFEYPMGTMFWARPEALAPLLRLGLTEADIPQEPLPVDGTILHAIECLLPFVADTAGFGYLTTFVEGSVR